MTSLFYANKNFQSFIHTDPCYQRSAGKVFVANFITAVEVVYFYKPNSFKQAHPSIDSSILYIENG